MRTEEKRRYTATMIDGYNSDIKSEQVQKLTELFSEVMVSGKVDHDAGINSKWGIA